MRIRLFPSIATTYNVYLVSSFHTYRPHVILTVFFSKFYTAQLTYFDGVIIQNGMGPKRDSVTTFGRIAGHLL